MTIRRSSRSTRRSTRWSTNAAADALKVLHIGKRSPPRCAITAPVDVFRTAHPRRPPLRFSISVRRALSLSPSDAQARLRAAKARSVRVSVSRRVIKSHLNAVLLCSKSEGPRLGQLRLPPSSLILSPILAKRRDCVHEVPLGRPSVVSGHLIVGE